MVVAEGRDGRGGRVVKGKELVVIDTRCENAGSPRFVGDAGDEEQAVDVTAQQLACGGETDEGEGDAARDTQRSPR